jgi:hypothetical protein
VQPACATTPVFCLLIDAAAHAWQIRLDPADRSHDARLERVLEDALARAEAWTTAEPHRAEAWFAQGAAYGVRADWRVLRKERIAAARDGKRIKDALERALAIDPQLHDAKFGIGMYRYYASVAPAALRVFRWLLLLPGGDRAGGLQQIVDASERGLVMRGEATYQLTLAYLWYENRSVDAMTLIRSLQQRYPHNPLFPLIEADVLDVYFHDTKASRSALHSLIARARRGDVRHGSIAARRATDALRALDARTRR